MIKNYNFSLGPVVYSDLRKSEFIKQIVILLYNYAILIEEIN